MNPALIALAIQEAPQAIQLLKDLFKHNNPNEPEPTDEQIMAAWHTAFASSLAKDEAWIAAHPQQ